jgi:hypothetical protein
LLLCALVSISLSTSAHPNQQRKKAHPFVHSALPDKGQELEENSRDESEDEPAYKDNKDTLDESGDADKKSSEKSSYEATKEALEKMKGPFGKVGVGASEGSIGYFKKMTEVTFFFKVTREYDPETGDFGEIYSRKIPLADALMPACSRYTKEGDMLNRPLYKLEEPLYEIQTDWQKVATAAAVGLGAVIFLGYIFGGQKKDT